LQYLKQRSDTVRCIVTSLTDEHHGELFEELRKNNMRVIQQDDDSDDDEDISPDLWEPDPIEADPTKTSRSRNSDDILRILVSLCVTLS
jgi:anaphase-promoting complex subunit 2